MEIISYSEKKMNVAPVFRTSQRKRGYKTLGGKKNELREGNTIHLFSINDSLGASPKTSRAAGGAYAARPLRMPRSFSFKDALLDFQGFLLFAKRQARSALPLFIGIAVAIPVTVAAVLIPHKAAERLAVNATFAHPLTLDADDETQLTLLDTALLAFAMDKGTYFDNEGNVVEEDGSVLPLNVSFKDPVTYRQYKVTSGDTISGISQKFGLSNISTLIAVNGINNARTIQQGQTLVIPSMDGLLHKVSAGETLEGLSVRYNVTVEDLLDVNDLETASLSSGQEIFIPGAKLDSQTLRRSMGEVFSWPITASWRLTSRFGRRADPFTGVASNHTGIDMACPTGTSIKAAMSGSVVVAGWSNIYGNYVIVKHIDGYQTLYGHMSKITAKKGQYVAQGEQIGLVGSTGYSTGPHLHFSVYKNGKLVDPLTVLK